MALFRSERGIGRGEVAESRIEAPFFAAFMAFCAVAVLVFHIYVQDPNLTVALAVSIIVFGLTILRVDLGVYVLVIAMLLSPEIEGGEIGRSGRVTKLRYDDILIIVIFLGVMVKLAFEGRLRFWQPSPINLGITCYYGICIISTLLALRMGLPAYDTNAALFVMLKMAEFYMVFILVGHALRDMKEVRNQLVVFFLVGLIVCIYCSLQINAPWRISAPFDEKGGTEPNTLGGYLIILMCIAGGLLTQAPTWRLKMMFLGIVFAAFVPFLFSLSRASYVAFIVAPLALGLMTRKYYVVLVVALVLSLSSVLMPAEVKDRVNYTFQRGTGEPIVIAGRHTGLQVDKSTYERIYVWQKVRYNLRVWPWLGGGVAWQSVLDSHYARVAIETGLLGLAAFVFMQLQMLRTCRDAYRWSRSWLGRGVAYGTATALVGIIVHSLGTITFLIIRIMEPLWFLLALTVVVRSLAIEEYLKERDAESAEALTGVDPVPSEL